MTRTFALISLGCPKNLVNSEQMLHLMYEAGYELIGEPKNADLVIINTCGFIDEAKQEAIETILSVAAENDNVIVTGCLCERYKEVIASELPEVKAYLGVGSYNRIVEAANAVLSGDRYEDYSDSSAPIDELPRIVSTGPSWAYIRIAEGCDNFCSFCAIPFIRGRYRSRKIECVIEEARDLAEHGIKELIIVAQDITRYGTDLYGKRMLAELCRQIADIDGIEWIRLHYLYPDQFDDELINEIATNKKIVKYLDIPIQHINNDILKKMNRRGSGDDIRKLLKKLRERIPGLVIRTTLILGLPGEGPEEFEELCEFLREAKIERAGVFPFSPEEGTRAAEMQHCNFDIAQQRADFIMSEIQMPIMDEFCSSFIGKTIKVLTQDFDEESGYLVGRCYADSPEIDGEVCFTGSCNLGDFTYVEIDSYEDGVLYGKEVEQ